MDRQEGSCPRQRRECQRYSQASAVRGTIREGEIGLFTKDSSSPFIPLFYARAVPYFEFHRNGLDDPFAELLGVGACAIGYISL